jgi:Rrf2 family protein
VNISAKSDYAVRAMLALAADDGGRPVKGETLAVSQQIPVKFLENILVDLRRAGLVASQRGAEGGYRLAKLPEEISIADVIRELEGPIATVRGARPDELEYAGPATGLREIWLKLRAEMRGVLEQTTLADLVTKR